MPTETSEDRDVTDALAICARIGDDLRNLHQTLGLKHAGADDAGLSAAAGELQVIQAHVDDLWSVLTAVVERDKS